MIARYMFNREIRVAASDQQEERYKITRPDNISKGSGRRKKKGDKDSDAGRASWLPEAAAQEKAESLAESAKEQGAAKARRNCC